MANQYKTALDEAVEELADKLTKATVAYDPDKRTISWSGIVFTIEPGTPKSDCLRKLNKLIAFEEKIRIRKNQGALL